MSPRAWLVLLLFTALWLVLSLLGLTASGHFPARHRVPALQTGTGRGLLYGSLACGALCLVAGIPFAWRAVPWYAVVIGGGAAVLFAPLVLQTMPDRFIDGFSALIAFGGAAILLTVALAWTSVAGAPL